MKASLILAVCLAALPGFGQEPIRVNVKLVSVGFSVRNVAGAFVANLEKDDFEIFEDGVPQKIAFFARSVDVPLNLGLVVDASGSQHPFVKQHHKDLEKFLKTVLGPQDRAFLVCFGNRLRLVQDYSSSAQVLAQALDDFHRSQQHYGDLGPREVRISGTAFYDALYYSIRERLADTERGRRALIMFSDGEDNSSAHHMLDAIETAQLNDVLLFSVRYTDVKHGEWNARNKYGKSVMERVALETGGADFDAREKGLADNFREIGEQLRASYSLAYHSTNPVADESFRKLSIRVKRPGLKARAKTGYYARNLECPDPDKGCVVPTTR